MEEVQEKSKQGPSQAKLRMEAMAKSVDHKLFGGFAAISLLYAMITIGAWMHIENQTITTTVSQAVTSSASKAIRDKRNQDVTAQEYVVHGVNKTIPQVKLEDIHAIETLQHTFPIHAGSDLEEIDHPGIFFADKSKFQKVRQRHSELDLPENGKIRVPKFWRPVAYGPEGVREFLGEHGHRLITPEEAKQIGSFVDGLETIYLSVASYRDPECRPTVEDIYMRAKYPERLRVAIIDQRAKDDPVPPCVQPQQPCETDPEQPLCKYGHLIDYFPIDAPLSVGPVYARHLANRMYRGEYFAMQVDSHVRFIEHWDSDIVSQWKSAKNEMGVLSVYLSDIKDSINPITHANQRPNRPIMCKTGYEGKGKMRHLRHGQQPEGKPGIHGEPTLHPFWAAGFSFARGHFVVQVPYDQFQPMVFQGEEIFVGLRGFTYGYDYYTPEKSVAFHMYAINENKAKRKKVKLFWENGDLYPGSAVEGMKRLNGIIGMGNPGDTYYHGQEEEYGLGQVRPKEKFFKLYGIHTDTQTVEDHLCRFVGKPMQSYFKPHLRSKGMGINLDEIDFEYVDKTKAKGGKK